MTLNDSSLPVAVLGGTGYVAGELLRLLHFHPHFRVACVVSTTQQNEPVAKAFPHLAGTPAGSLSFESSETLCAKLARGEPHGIFAATPHGSTAALLSSILDAAEQGTSKSRAVDLSADFRFRNAARYEAIYRQPHCAPNRLPQFTCAVPEHVQGKPTLHATQPGCFTTATTLGAWPFFALGLVEPHVFVSAVTGSSGSGRTPSKGTHHPERHSNFVAYSPLTHRHEAEMRMLLGAAQGQEPEVDFVPHSGPFVRGIHATLRMTLIEPASAAELVSRVSALHTADPFLSASAEPPRLTDVVGTNRCQLGIATRGRTLVVTSVIDNLVKGAAGGAIQWMNRLFELPDDTGLILPGLGWY